MRVFRLYVLSSFFVNDSRRQNYVSYLNRLPVVAEDINPHDSFIEIGICTLNNIIIEVLFVSQCVQTLEHKVE